MCKTICMNRKVEFSGWQALERIPENCGCGGRTTVCRGSTNPPYYWVECEDCHVSTMAAMKLTEAEAIEAWNTAMSGKTDIYFRVGKRSGNTLESAVDYLRSVGWLQEHDRIMTESAELERKSMVWTPAKGRPAYEKGVCSCGYVLSVLQRDFVYCPMCGARLEWGKETDDSGRSEEQPG